jgi:hemerythrin-like domain-containing protein
LFPALEAAGVSREGGPIGALMGEHEHGRRLVARLEKTVANYMAGDKTATAEFQVVVDKYVSLMLQHIEKENKGLFITAESKLDTAKDNELFENFEQLEKERIGLGKHEEFHALLNRLEHEFLK